MKSQWLPPTPSIVVALIGMAVLGACWFGLDDSDQVPTILPATSPAPEMLALHANKPFLETVERDVAGGHCTLREGVQRLAPIVDDSLLRNALVYFEGTSDAEKLSRMLLKWVEIRLESGATAEQERVLGSLRGELDRDYPPMTLVRMGDEK